MDEINDFMDFSKPFERVTLPPPPNQIREDANASDVQVRTHTIGQRNTNETEYANEYQKKELNRMIDVKQNKLF